MEAMPEDWKRGVICLLFKKGDNTVCDNYRGIALVSQAAKVYSRISEKRVRACVEDLPGEWQHGFRPGRGIIDLVFTMKMILETGWEWGFGKFILFIDMEKAFDRVPRQRMWSILANDRYEIPCKLMRVIINSYSQCLSKVRGRDTESE